MSQKEKVLKKLKELKPKYAEDGFIIKGIFGSTARDEAIGDSDIDILYDIDQKNFSDRYSGFIAFSRLADIRKELQEIFQKNVDICALSGLSKTGEKYILEESIYV